MGESTLTTTTEAATIDVLEAAAICGISRSSFLRLDTRGELGPMSFRLGARRRVWLRSELMAWLSEAAKTGKAPCRREWLSRKKGAA